MEVFWGPVPSNKWNGNPEAITLQYWISKRGANYIVGEPAHIMTFAPDRQFYRISGLEINTEVSVILMGKTKAGHGKKSSLISGSKTIQLHRNLNIERICSSSFHVHKITNMTDNI